MTDRTPGRYNLHRLGWKAFEDLCVEVLRGTLGATVTPFSVGADAGRDIFFKGEITAKFIATTNLPAVKSGTMVVQCKHTSSPGDSLTLSHITEELPKVTKLVDEGECDLYILMSNRRVSGGNEALIRQEVEKKAQVKICRVFGEEWVESTIDDNYRLMRRVPRLFGVGDLSQILSQSAAQKTTAVIQDMSHELRTFVPTPSYTEALDALERHRMVVLVGGAGSGKSSIALNICVVWSAENPEIEVIRATTAADLDRIISMADTQKIYWIDDVFGQTRLDEQMAKMFSRAFHNFKAAHSAGAMFIFTCRDYIFKSARQTLKSSHAKILTDQSVVVRVDNISTSSKEKILYNHLKYGNIKKYVRTHLKILDLPRVASMPDFSPEVARRLGDERFHRQHLMLTQKGIETFFRRPVHFFAEVIEELGEPERAAIAYILVEGNKLSDPVQRPPDVLAAAYDDVTTGEIRKALEAMRGSLVKLMNVSPERYWQVHHPSMIDAMQEILATKETMRDVYLAAVRDDVFLRDVGTGGKAHRVNVPRQLYPLAMSRLRNMKSVISVAEYLLVQSKDFLRYLLDNGRDVLERCVNSAYTRGGRDNGLRLLVKLADEEISHELLEIYQRRAVTTVVKAFCIDLLRADDLSDHVDENVVREVFQATLDNISDVISSVFEEAHGFLYGDADRNLNDSSDILEWIEELEVFEYRMLEHANEFLDEKECQRVKALIVREFVPFLHDLESIRTEFLELEVCEEQERENREVEPRGILDPCVEESIFSDVDE